ncbi:MAG: hypothetical protein OJF49_002649 [Ktedonobacterales bacterium]|nr:MAG: hypothetical protein OJF49_002649 [Ktedonobacterales bacterium]
MNEDDLDGIEERDWTVRALVYTFIAQHERPPTVGEAAAALNVTHDRVALAFQRLNRRHAVFLEPGAQTIRMAHPFSAIPTSFWVRANGHSYWANCAWDMLGIPAALHTDAEIEARVADTQHTGVTLDVIQNRVHGHGEVVHFPLPFHQWYDDLVFT